MGWQWGQCPWKRFPYIQVSDVLCYKLIPIIYRTSLLQNSLKVIISNMLTEILLLFKMKLETLGLIWQRPEWRSYDTIPLVSLFLACCVNVRVMQGVLKDSACSWMRVSSCDRVMWLGRETPGQAGCCNICCGTAKPETNEAVGDVESASSFIH